MNDDRVRLVHGTWFLEKEGWSAEHVSRQSLNAKAYFEDGRALRKAVEECMAVAKGLIPFFIQPGAGGTRASRRLPRNPPPAVPA